MSFELHKEEVAQVRLEKCSQLSELKKSALGKRTVSLFVPSAQAAVAVRAEAWLHCSPGTFPWCGRNWSAADFF